jgi:ABC-type phosphate/phosphonate transport system substrate-binding protein
VIAALPMYDGPEAAAANDRFWALIRDGLRAAGQGAPDALTRTDDLWAVWQSPDLVLAQTCGLPFRARLHDRVTLVGTPDYGVEGCPPGYYRSVLVARADDPRLALVDFDGATLAYNEALSQSGWAAPLAAAAEAGIVLRPGPMTGAHRASARAVAEGRAALAAIDAVTWRMIRGPDRLEDALRVVGHTAPTPGLPLIARAGADAAALFRAVAQAIPRLAPGDAACLGLRGMVAIPAETYLAQPLPPPAPAGPGG